MVLFSVLGSECEPSQETPVLSDPPILLHTFGVSGLGGLCGCGGGLYPGGVGSAGLCSEEPLQRCDAGKLPEPGLRG